MARSRPNPTGNPSSGKRAAIIGADPVVTAFDGRSIVLVGMMGAGKSSVGRRLAQRLGLEFTDADQEIEKAAGKTIPEIFEDHGEAEFRAGERRVLARLLEDGGPMILATGGGAFMDNETRALIKEQAISVWLKAEFAVLMERVRRKSNRPLLQTADPEGTLRDLLAVREPVYAEADITVQSENAPHQKVVTGIVDQLRLHVAAGQNGAGEPDGA